MKHRGPQNHLRKVDLGPLDAVLCRDHAVGIEHELFRRPFIEVLVALDRLIERHNRDVHSLGDLDLSCRIAIISCRLYFITGH